MVIDIMEPKAIRDTMASHQFLIFDFFFNLKKNNNFQWATKNYIYFFEKN